MEDPLWRREVREQWRRPWTFLLLGVYALFLAILARVFYGSLVPQGDIPFSKQGLGLGAPLFWNFVTCQIGGWFPLGVLLGAPLLALERERQSLAEYALAGLSSWQIVRAKWWSLAPFALVLVITPLPIAALCFPLGGVSPLDFLSANILCIGVALASCSIGLALSAVNRTVSAAYVGAIKRIISTGLFLCPFLVVAPRVPPLVLLVLGVLFATLPWYLLLQIDHEIAWVMARLESDAPHTPDSTLSEEEVPLRLEPMMMAIAQGSALAHEPMNSQELAQHINAEEAGRGLLDPPASHLDLALENCVAHNPLARRDVQTQLRSWRRQLLIGEPPPLFSWRVSLCVGSGLGLVGVLASQSGMAVGLYLLWRVGVLVVLLQVSLLAAGGFSRERAGNMMVQLQLSGLSRAEIVGAKIVVPLVISARLWGFTLLILWLASANIGPLRLALDFFLFLLLAVLCSVVGTLCSLSFRAVALSTTLTFFALGALFLVLPGVFSPMLFQAPIVLQQLWLAPLHTLLWSMEGTSTMALLALPCSALVGGLWLLCLWAWEKSVQKS